MQGELSGYLPFFIASFAIALITVPVFRALSYRVGALDRGGGRRMHAGVVPRLGGAGIFCSFGLPALYFMVSRSGVGRLPVILAASAVVFALGVYDDIKGVSIRYKLFFEVIAALLVYYMGVRVIRIDGGFELGWLSLPATVLWILIVTNAINLIDGLDGLAAGTGILVSVTLLLVSGGASGAGIPCVLLAGSLAGFLFYNFPPASVFMGDSGSLFAGFILASLSAASSAKASTAAALMVPILAFGVPLMDMLYAVLRRYYRGLPLGLADREHIHHKLLEKGLSRKRVLFVLYTVNAAIMLLCLMIAGRHWRIRTGVLVSVPVLMALGLRFFGYIEFIPFVKEILRHFEKGRKGRYYSYLVKRFRQSATRADSLDSFSSRISEIAKLDGMGSVEIILAKNPGNAANVPEPPAGRLPDFIYLGNSNGEKTFTVNFPITGGDTAGGPAACMEDHRLSGVPVLGLVRMTGNTGGDFPLYCAEMAQALSEEISGFLAKSQSFQLAVRDSEGIERTEVKENLETGLLDPVFHK